MTRTIILRDESLSGSVLNEIPVEVTQESITLAELISVRVHQEVKRYNEKLSGHFQGLVQPSKAEQTLNGYKLNKKESIDAEQQTYIALNAFQQNAFFVLIDEAQVESLQQEIIIQDNTHVSFVKLTPLVGG